MSSKTKRKKTDNAHVWLKVAVRREAIAALTDVRVLDCFAGNNVLWKEIKPDYYLGIEKVKGKGSQNIYGDNVRLIPSLDLSRYNVIDLDSYGIPASQLLAVVQNETLPDSVVIVYTAIGGAIARGSKKLMSATGIRSEAYEKCPMLWNKKMLDLWYALLAKIGVEKINLVVLKENTYEKHYGYFVLNKNAINDIIRMLR